MNREHPFSWEALSRIALMGFGILLLWKAVDAMVIIVISLIFAASLFPLVDTLHKKTKLPILFSILAVFFLILIPFIVLGITIFPSLGSQLPGLLTNINTTVSHIPYVSRSFVNFNIGNYIQAHSSFVLNYSTNIVVTVVSIVTTIVLTFYLIYDYEKLLTLFLGIFPYQEKNKLKEILEEIALVSGQYIRGNVLISIISSFVIFIGLTLMHVPFALPLAIFSGIMDLLPLVGFTIGAIPSLLVAFSISSVKGFLTLILYLIYQQVENGVIGPMIYNKTLDLYPSLSFVAVLLGASLFGIVGAFLALPIAASIPALFEYHKSYKTRHAKV